MRSRCSYVPMPLDPQAVSHYLGAGRPRAPRGARSGDLQRPELAHRSQQLATRLTGAYLIYPFYTVMYLVGRHLRYHGAFSPRQPPEKQSGLEAAYSMR